MNWAEFHSKYANPKYKDLIAQMKSQLMSVLKSVNPHGSISMAAMDNMCGMMLHVMDQAVEGADNLRLAHASERQFISEHDISKAMQLIVSGQTYSLMVARAEYSCKLAKENKHLAKPEREHQHE